MTPDERGRGIGRALLGEAMRVAALRGADTIDLDTTTDDVAARHLYESMGMRFTESGPDGPPMVHYEREL